MQLEDGAVFYIVNAPTTAVSSSPLAAAELLITACGFVFVCPILAEYNGYTIIILWTMSYT
jgi:hypothetical protein